jgi:hypothetical protein
MPSNPAKPFLVSRTDDSQLQRLNANIAKLAPKASPAGLAANGLGYFVQGCEALALVASQGDVEATKGKLDGRLGSETLGICEAPTPVTRDLECLAHGHAAPNAETGPSGLRAAVFHEGRQQECWRFGSRSTSALRSWVSNSWIAPERPAKLTP